MTICSHSHEGKRSWYCSLDLDRRVCYGHITDAKKGRPDFCPLYGGEEEDDRGSFVNDQGKERDQFTNDPGDDL